MESRRPWDPNIHYHDLVLAEVPPGVIRVLDVGCGDGLLAARFAERGAAEVAGMDVDRAVLERARARHGDSGVRWVHADVFTCDERPGSFDAVVSVAALHHMDAERGLRRFADLTKVGGVVVVVGLAANDWWDWPAAALAVAAREALCVLRGRWNHSAPQCWPPPLTYREIRRLAGHVLPGVRYRRHLLQRYSLAWRRPR